jgi:hypothetical protein
MKIALGHTITLLALGTIGTSALVACGTSPTTFVGEADAATDAVSGSDVGLDAMDTASDAPLADGPESDIQPDLQPDAEPDTEPEPPDALPDTPIEDVSPSLEASCQDACSTRAEDGMGACPISLEQDCTDWCIEVGPQVAPELEDAYFQCIAEDPLCFQSILQCAIALTYPEPFPHTVTLRGSGFDAWDGDTVYAGIEQTADEFVRVESIVAGGEFTVEFDVVMHVSQSHLTLFYVDANSNESCDTTEDETGTGSIELWSLPPDVMELPEWEIEVSPNPDRDAGFVCMYL